jgi:hypothetical protein
MTRKDYILLAEALRIQRYNASIVLESAKRVKDSTNPPAYECGVINGIDYASDEIADALAHDNARFDKDHFLAVVRGERDLRSRPSRQGERL